MTAPLEPDKRLIRCKIAQEIDLGDLRKIDESGAQPSSMSCAL